MDDIHAWLKLVAVPGLGGHRISRLLQHAMPEQIMAMDESELRSIGLTLKQVAAIKHPDNKKIDLALNWQQRPYCHIISLVSPLYPPLLKEISSAPPLLFVKGDPSFLAQPQIAIIGSRSASIDGREIAADFAANIVAQNYVVTSGLALGIDSQAHQGALRHGGATIAVLGSGLEQIYPACHKSLAASIVEQGALVSEFWPQEKPRAQFFPRRNRIISGLSVGVLVVEAAQKSGSLITANYALEQGREVFAIPGSIYNPASRGCNALIKSGAKLVESAQDIFEEVGALTECAINHQLSQALPETENEQLPFPELLATVGSEVIPVDVLAERSQMPVHDVMTQLLELELLGLVTALPGGYIRTRRG
ncbi:TPA: DNA-processing protein DprA [Photobacterium damselae]|uniref:DNA-processing protein DprA n=1 Tax=Photobacterium damselae TaxID=38293 RepID=UPI001592E98D|nr:DNA-processing protein DprA [Photobacterium damselae]MCG3825517.1 DNA-protecting protein DprA [Photobacterium damselae]NVH48573.1 DNA-protecting protein DprA [Photobacterium damselae subsp. damselae]